MPALFDSKLGVLGGPERYAFELARHINEEVLTTLISFGPKDPLEAIGLLKIQVIGKPLYMRGQVNPSLENHVAGLEYR